MNLILEKQVEEVRGKILFLSYGTRKFHIVEIKKGFARGGHYHKFDQLHIIISGKIECYQKNISTEEEEYKIIHSPEQVLIPGKIAHLFIALEDTIFIETYENEYEATDYKEYRKIVMEKMNLR